MDILQQTVTDVLVERIRHEIIRGRFKPGERLRLQELAERYKVSTMPVREALQTLASEGLVVGEARRGVTVTQLTIGEIEDIYEIRATLEAMATRLAAPHVTADLLETLRQITGEMEQYERQDERVKLVDANTRFHETLYAVAHRKHLFELISTLRHRTAHYLYTRTVQGGGSLACQEHYEMIAALQAGNVEQAARILCQHILDAGRSAIDFLQQNSKAGQ